MAECLALERINRLLDEGSFVEVGDPVGVWAVSQSQCGRSPSQVGY